MDNKIQQEMIKFYCEAMDKRGRKTNMFQEAPGQTSMRRVCFFISFIFSLLVIVFYIVAACFSIPIPTGVETMTLGVLTITAGLFGVGRWVEGKENQAETQAQAQILIGSDE